MEKTINKDNLKDILENNVVIWTFTKVNGESRQTIGTRAVLNDSEF